MSPVLPTPPPPDHSASPAGWYADPWRVSPWRWWDGHTWTVHVADVTQKKPRLPAWLSPPVVAAAVPSVPGVAVLAVLTPIAVALGLVPLLIVLPALAWLDRVEPEPRSSRIHALLWGAFVAGFISVVVNSLVALGAGETWAAVASAPLIEEASKAAGLLWAVRRKEIDGVVDGVVYAGWIALGFAVIEDFSYFAVAAEDGTLWQVFVLRAFLTPFAHPLFTAWSGLAVGLAAAEGKPILPRALWGLALAVATHAAWNGSIALADSTGEAWVLLLAMVVFVALFGAAIVVLRRLRRNEREHFIAAVPFLANRYRLPPTEVEIFRDWATLLSTRKRLPRVDRKNFDIVHRSLARLAVLHGRPGETNFAQEELLNAQLQRARRNGGGAIS